MRQKAVIKTKQSQLQRCFIAFGVYLRKFFIEHLERDSIVIDTKAFGKYSLVDDPEADQESLYPKKLIFEPSGLLAKVTPQRLAETERSRSVGQLLCKKIDYGKLARLVHSQSERNVKQNLDVLGN